MSAKDKVWAVVEERAKAGAKGYALQYVVKESGLNKEEALLELDALAEQGLVEKSWAYICPDCGRTQKVFKDGEEPAVYEDHSGCDSCSDGGSLYLTRDMAWVQFSAAEKLVVPEEVVVEPGIRARKSPLAERQEDQWA
jgi:hypothetical protein